MTNMTTTKRPVSPPNVVVTHGKGEFTDLDKGHFIVVKPRTTARRRGDSQAMVMRNWQIGNQFSDAIAAIVRQELAGEIERITRSVIQAMVDKGGLTPASLGISPSQ